MKQWFSTLALIVCLTFAFVAEAELRAGMGIRNVTPDPLLPISGGGGEPSPSNDKRGELEIRALVVEQGDTRVAIVNAPYVGFPRVLGDRVRDRVKSIPGSNIVIGATHSHSAPEMYAFPDGKGGTWADLEYIDWVCTEVAKAIELAVVNLQPAKVKIATGEAKGKIAYNYYAPKLYDPRANVMQFLDTEDKPFITLVNYAIHPEVLGPNSGFVSPDLVGPLHDRIEELGGGQGIFMNGAQGGMVTADCRGPNGKDIQTWEECIRIGNLLAEESLRIVKDAPIQEDANLYVAVRELEFPVENEMMLGVVKYSPLGYPMSGENTVSTQLNLINLGNAQMITIPGEALPNIGYYLKEHMRGEHNFLLGLTNDGFGYILTREDFGSFKRYEYITETSLGERTGTIYVDEALAFIKNHPKAE
ncbi:MAG: hypothetical protein VCD00_17690 [Candidatus Hydrogenedentota bacterium]